MRRVIIQKVKRLQRKQTQAKIEKANKILRGNVVAAYKTKIY